MKGEAEAEEVAEAEALLESRRRVRLAPTAAEAPPPVYAPPPRVAAAVPHTTAHLLVPFLNSVPGANQTHATLQNPFSPLGLRPERRRRRSP
jgi:hypothetical protein